jgi:putative membrane protein
MTAHLAIAVAVAMLPATARAQTGAQDPARAAARADQPHATETSPANANPAANTLDPARVLQKLHGADKDEIDAGKLAQRKGSSSGMKEYGKMLVDDHSKADKDLEKVAKQMKVKLDDSKLTSEDREDEKKGKESMKEAEKKSGAEFDRAFATAMAADHSKDIAFVQRAQQGAQGDLKNLLDKMLPVLQRHLDKAKELQSARNTANAK